MSVVLTSGVSTADAHRGVTLTNARIAYDTFTRDATVLVSSDQTDFPGEAMKNPLSYELWKPSSLPATARFTASSALTVDYCAIAFHDMATQGNSVSVEYSTDGGSTWTTVNSTTPSDNAPILFLFEAQSAADWRIVVSGGTIPQIAHVMLGEVLAMQRSIYGGHSPITLSRNTVIRPNKSEGGGWLGRSILRKGFSTSFEWSNLKAAWFRANFDPFIESARRYPFVIAWKPNDYPDELAYCWTNGDIQPNNSGTKDYMDVSLDVEGLYEL